MTSVMLFGLPDLQCTKRNLQLWFLNEFLKRQMPIDVSCMICIKWGDKFTGIIMILRLHLNKR
jgi:hypothetical protein